MSLAIHLLGRPAIVSEARDVYRFRSRKSWALLAYLVLSERPASRAHLASLLFSEADDPLRALRWNLAEIRRALGSDGEVEGDPVTLTFSPDTMIDVVVVTRGTWAQAVALPGLDCVLLDSVNVRGAAGFDSWLLSEQRRLSAACEAILHEAALGSLARGSLTDAIGYAARSAAMSPLDENHQALLISLYRKAGDHTAAQRQYDSFARTLAAELGVRPGPAVESAVRVTRLAPGSQADGVSIAALVEAGSAAVAAGAVEAGVTSLRTAVQFADGFGDPGARVSSRQALAEALIHSLRGRDEEGLSTLHAADEIAEAAGDRRSMAEARAELGYVDFLRARYDRAEFWLREARDLADDAEWIVAKAITYLGSVESDRADYPTALRLLEESVRMARGLADGRREAYAVSMLGRIHLLRGELDLAAGHLDQAIAQCEHEHWLAFLPWPQALRGAVEQTRGNTVTAADHLEQAFARACQLGDPCWEGMAARGLALVAESDDDVDGAFTLLEDARVRCNRVTDPYVWLDAHILDAQCELGVRHGHPRTGSWIAEMQALASRTAMREMTVRALLHATDVGDEEAGVGAALLAAGIDNPLLQDRVARGLQLAR